jgi:ABC-type uncharacterized transport system substrate-binding protein
MNPTTLPPFDCLQLMDIIIQIEKALAGEGNMVTFSLKKAINDKRPAKLIIQTIKDMIRDNENGMAFILGNTLTQKIKKIEL